MSRDIVDRRTHGTLVVERLVAPGGVEGEVAEEFAFLAEDSDVEVGDEDDDASSFVGAADTDVVEAGAVAEGEFAGGVDAVVTDPGVGCHGVAVRVGRGFDERVERLAGWDHPAGGMGSGLVVVADEPVDLGL